jgi:hypothetical protein
MFLDVRTYHYGFVLAAPCAMMGVAGMMDWLPSAIGRGGGSARTARVLAIGLLSGLAFNRMLLTGQILSERTLEIPLAFGGSLHARPIDEPAALAVAWLKGLPPAARAAVYPDAAGIGFAAGKSSGVPYSVLNPMTVGMWGQENAIRSMAANPPDVILIVRTDAGALGGHWFGEDYAGEVMDWIRGRYERWQRFGEEGADRGIWVWRRKESLGMSR